MRFSTLFLLLLWTGYAPAEENLPFQNPRLPVEERVRDLVQRLTLAEKVSQMQYTAAAIPRLGIPEYNWWNEALHGVARAGFATVFPQAIGLAATWDDDLMHRVAEVISIEARAKHHEFVRRGSRDIYQGLTFWSPNINLFRDPRWGRGQETYGEDPYLTGQMGLAFVRGMQGDDPHYLRTVATPKHFAVHSGPEPLRHAFDARISERDLRETYLPAFETCIREGGAFSIMCAYNRLDGEACCANHYLLSEILRDEWKFSGYVVSDCWAISDIYNGHHLVENTTQAAARALLAGCDLSCGPEFASLQEAVENGLASEKDIDRAVMRLFTARFRLGMFDPPEMVAYARIPYSSNDSVEHDQLALQAARESLVLLKNTNQTLPLNKNLHRIAVIGPNANDVEVLLGNYNGTPSHPVTPLQGIRDKVTPDVQVDYALGCDWAEPGDDRENEAMKIARSADVVILCMGLSPRLEGEEMEVTAAGFHGGDRVSIDLPAVQQQLIERIASLQKPTVLVLLSGSAVAVNWANDHLPAILQAWYPGQRAGTAIADALFGDYNPAGRLPVTFYKSAADLPPFDDYQMAGRTYRFFDGQALFPFGYGLSYTDFQYSALKIAKTSVRPGEPVTLSCRVKNTGARAGDEVVQVYLSREPSSSPRPLRYLAGFKRIHLLPGQPQQVEFVLQPQQLADIGEDGKKIMAPGSFMITVGGCGPQSERMEKRPSGALLSTRFRLVTE